MQSRPSTSKFVLALCLVVPAVTSQAGNVSVDCAKKSLATEIGKLTKLTANTVNISGSCNEDIQIDGYLNLTLIGSPGASISATGNTIALAINSSTVTVQALTLNGGVYGALCENRSTCIFRDVTVQDGGNGIGAQGQSAIDIIGASSIVDSLNTGIGVYGASSVNIRPTWANGFDPAELGPVISGHLYGAFVMDGSFLRTDSVTISENGYGVWAQRNATIKIFGNQSGATVSGNTDAGVKVWRSSVGQLGINFSANGWDVDVGALSYVTLSGSTFNNISCSHPTAVLEGGASCPNP